MFLCQLHTYYYDTRRDIRVVQTTSQAFLPIQIAIDSYIVIRKQVQFLHTLEEREGNKMKARLQANKCERDG